MDKLIVRGATKLTGKIKVTGAKNVAMKVILAAVLTDEPLVVKNVPLISSVSGTAKILKHLGVDVTISLSHTLKICAKTINSFSVPLECGGLYRTATMVMGPLLTRFRKAVVPNPGGCRLGKRPIERHIEGLKAMGAQISYKDGFFYAEASRLSGTRYRFDRNTHTGTETLILASVLADGQTTLTNAAEEPEIDDLIKLLNKMGANIKRTEKRTIVIKGVKKLSGTEFEIMPDRNEVVTFAIGAIASGGNVVVDGAQTEYLGAFLEKLSEAGAGWEKLDREKVRFFYKNKLKAVDIETASYPGFMTDWQAPWAILMTQAQGSSKIHETIYENRFGYVEELRKMGAKIDFFAPSISHPEKFYNFNWAERERDEPQAIKITGRTKLHDAVLDVTDLRAGATLLLAAIIASGTSIIHGIDHIDRGYEDVEKRLNNLGAEIKRIKHE